MVKKLIVPLVFALLFVIAGLGVFVPRSSVVHAMPQQQHYSCFGESCDNLISVPEGCNVNEVYENQKNVYDSHNVVIGVLHLFRSSSSGCNTWWGAFDNTSPYTYTLNGVETVSTGSAGSDAEIYYGGGASGPCSPHISPGWCSAGMQGSNTGLCYHAYSAVTDEYGVGELITNTNTFCV